MPAETLTGDWRSGAYGGNRRAHLFVWQLGGRKGAACGVATTAKYGRRQTDIDPCRDCLAHRQ